MEETVRKLLALLRIAAPLLTVCGVAALYNASNADGWTPAVADFLRSVALVGFLPFPFGVYLLVDGLYNLVSARSAARWPQTIGKVTASGVRQTIWDYGSLWHVPKVTYRYDVGGVPFEGDTIQTARMVFSSDSDAEKACAKYPVSSEVAVRYDPKRPDRAVLEPGYDAARHEIIVGLWAFAAPIVLAALLTRLDLLV